MDRYEPIELPVFCNIRILRKDKWYDMRPLCVPVKRAKKIVSRLRRMGRTVRVTWIEGMG